jgi:hypothetical protein
MTDETLNTDELEKVEAQLLERLGELLRNDDNRWEIGDILNDLRARFDWTFEELAQRFDYSRARLVQFAQVAGAFTPQQRDVPVPFIIYEYGRLASERVAREVGLNTGVEEEPDYVGDLQFIADERAKGRALTDQRSVTAALAERARSRIDAQAAQASVIHQAQNAAFLGNCHNAPNAGVIAAMADRSVKLFHFDPPFGNYRRDEDGHLDISTSVGLTDCDNDGLEAATAVTVAALRAAVPKLVTNGVVLMWQAATIPVGAVARAVEELQLGGVPFIVWNKRRPKLGDAVEAIQYSVEVCFVLCRRGEKPLQHDPSLSKLQVIDDVPPINFRTESLQRRHQMEKPVALSERLLQMFTREGDVVVDGFGCSGSFCVAAERLRRRWVYCESNPSNFAFGTANIRREVEASEAASGTVA